MNLANYLIVFAVCASLSTGTFTYAQSDQVQNCIQPSLFNFTICKEPPSLSNTSSLVSDCKLSQDYIQCMAVILSRVCESDVPKNQYFIQKITRQLVDYNTTHDQACNDKQIMNSKRNVYVSQIKNESDDYDELGCNDIRQYKCESRSLFRTCGYPAANPKSNRLAFCNEMRAYLKCAKCKISLCKLRGDTAYIERQETE